jgi:hypothetical protein
MTPNVRRVTFFFLSKHGRLGNQNSDVHLPIMLCFVGVHWIHLALDRDQWQAVVSTVMNIRVAQKVENFLTS